MTAYYFVFSFPQEKGRGYPNRIAPSLDVFTTHQLDLLCPKKGGEQRLIPYDWTIYYLRKKVLYNPITPQELAWILLNFNQKRGYYQLRGEDEEDQEGKLVKFYALKVVGYIHGLMQGAKNGRRKNPTPISPIN